MDRSLDASQSLVPNRGGSSSSPPGNPAVTWWRGIAPPPHKSSPAQRWLSLAEFVLGAAIVIGYNVYHVLPNEVPILFVIGLISLRVRDGGWGVIGLRWPVSWRRTVLFALAAAATRILLGQFVTDPITAHFWPPAVGPSGFNEITGHAMVAVRWLLLVWTFAAFGEEISYRGYLLTRAADVGARSQAAYWVAVLMVSVLFGYGHYYKGPSGILDSGMAGLVLGAAYLFIRAQPVGVHSGARLYRLVRSSCLVLRMGKLGSAFWQESLATLISLDLKKIF